MSSTSNNSATQEDFLQDRRSDREILEETNRLVQKIALRGARTVDELRSSMRLLPESLSVLALSNRTLQTLIEAGVSTVEKLAQHTNEQLLAIPSLSRLSRNEIVSALGEHGIRLRHGEPGLRYRIDF